MTPCNREGEILDSLRGGRLDPDLRVHAERCSACSDLIEVAGALLDDRNTLVRKAPIPGSGLVWWRTTMRARQEEARTVVRTARIVQAALVTLAVVTGIALLAPSNPSIDFRAIASSMGAFVIPIAVMVALLILAPLAVYFVFSEE